MTLIKKTIALACVAIALAGCSSKFKDYDGPAVTQVLVMKSDRKMYLLHGQRALKVYDIGLGFAPIGDKKVSGDGKTPVGYYTIDRRNPNSKYHLSIGINYPNEDDILEAIALGKDPGGDIFIHGEGPTKSRKTRDWTWGCIAVTNKEMEDIYAMVKDGTPIAIYE